MEETPAAYYRQQITTQTAALKIISKRINTLSLLRLICATALVVLIYFLFKPHNFYLWTALLIDIAAFVFFIKASATLKEKKKFKEELVRINENEIKALSYHYSAFDAGNEFIDTNHPFSFDLDVFGDKSLFQMINRTSTSKGKEMLAKYFTELNINPQEIRNNQEAIAELKDKIEWRQYFQATGQLTPNTPSDIEQIQKWHEFNNKFTGNRFYAYLRIILPAATLAVWLLYAFKLLAFGIPLCFSLLQLMITLMNTGYISQRQNVISKRLFILKKFHGLIRLAENETFTAKKLASLKNDMLQDGLPSSASFLKLVKLVDALDNRLNIILAILLNAFLLWDINCMYRIEKSVEKFKPLFPGWIKLIGEFDVLSSLACFMYNHPKYCVPLISEAKDFNLETKAIGHPLINKAEVITNDFIHNSKLNLYLVTGANMSGKSTFLRTIGINIILASTGSCVSARTFAYTPARLCTSMRVNDSLLKHTSYFFAELNRLKMIVNQLSHNQNTYILLDEILKGTNSKDQHTGSAKLIEHIIKLNGKGIIATHDTDLAQLSEKFPDKIRNIAFEIEMKNNEMIFDYTYKDGVCQTMNATLLMEQMKIF
ncbi:MAG TPA: hypothetical protein VGB84_05085 [Arachidicoccus sp.]